MDPAIPAAPTPPPGRTPLGRGSVLTTIAMAIVLGGAAAAFLLLDPARAITGAAALSAGRGLAVAVLTLWASTGAGSALLGRVDAPRLEEDGGWAWALGLGVGLHSLVLLVLFFAGLVTPVSSAVVVVLLAAGWLRRPWPRPPRVGPLAALVGALLLSPALFDAFAPATDTDEIYYQLAAPKYLLDRGDLGPGLLHPDHARPLPIQLIHASSLALGGESAPRLWHLGVSIALLLGVRVFAERRFGSGHGDLPALALAGSYSFVREAGLAYNNLPCALWLLLAAVAALDGAPLLVGLAAGFAIAAKFTAAPAAAALFVVVAFVGLRGGALGPIKTARSLLPRWLGAGVLAALPTVPWALRNVFVGLHPLFPFAGWPVAGDFVFVYPAKYGDGHTWLDALLLPLRLLYRAEPDSFVFYGRLSLLWLALGVGALAALRRDQTARRLVAVVAIAFVAWASSAQLLRYLLPVAGVAALLGGVTRPRRLYLLLFAASFPANLGPALSHAAARAAVVTGRESPDTFLTRELPAWPAVRYLREHVPQEETVALLNSWPSYWIIQPYVLGSVEDNVPIRYWLWAHGEQALVDLRAEGVRWLLVGDIAYLKKTYAFLPPAVYTEQFVKQQSNLEQLLLRDATRVFRENHHSVWRLDGPSPPP